MQVFSAEIKFDLAHHILTYRHTFTRMEGISLAIAYLVLRDHCSFEPSSCTETRVCIDMN